MPKEKQHKEMCQHEYHIVKCGSSWPVEECKHCGLLRNTIEANCPPPTKEIEDWEERFEEFHKSHCDFMGGLGSGVQGDLKSFIRQLRQSSFNAGLQRAVEVIKEYDKKNSDTISKTESWITSGFSSVVGEILDSLEKEIK